MAQALTEKLKTLGKVLNFQIMLLLMLSALSIARFQLAFLIPERLGQHLCGQLTPSDKISQIVKWKYGPEKYYPVEYCPGNVDKTVHRPGRDPGESFPGRYCPGILFGGNCKVRYCPESTKLPPQCFANSVFRLKYCQLIDKPVKSVIV